MPSYNMTRELLANLLVEAKKAHSLYEQQLGSPDENWPDWYAGYILERLPGETEAQAWYPGLE